jgi:3-deoxy-D-manno-octulosonate 8-phosphate phosphatase (KDO 8-P phosphatase)
MEGFTNSVEGIEIIISEVDGILTNGTYPVDELGNTPFKTFYHKDFEAINLLKKHFRVVFIAADNKVNYNMFRAKQIPFYYESKNKKHALLHALKRYSLTPDKAIYLGSSYSDIDCMRQVPMSVCPEDAVPQVKELAVSVMPIFSGDGIFCQLYEMLRPEIKRRSTK